MYTRLFLRIRNTITMEIFASSSMRPVRSEGITSPTPEPGKRASIGYDMSMDATPPTKKIATTSTMLMSRGAFVSKKKMTVANGTAMEPMNSSPGRLLGSLIA
jgi:hypothetical protein